MDKQYNHILTALGRYLEPDARVEIRHIAAGKTAGMTVSHFDGIEQAAKWALEVSNRPTTKGVYFVPNPIARDFAPAKRGGGANAPDILRRRWVFIDIDPERPKGVNATDAERAAARAVFDAVEAHLAGLGFTKPVRACSGNGWHLAYPVDLPNDDSSKRLVERFLKDLAERFDTAAAKVDTGLFDANRIWKIPGTMTRKGDDAAERPHRLSFLLDEKHEPANQHDRAQNGLGLAAARKAETPARVEPAGETVPAEVGGKAEPLAPSGRNNRLTQIGGYFRRMGLDEAQVLAQLRQFNTLFNEPLDDAEMATVARHMQKYGVDVSRLMVESFTDVKAEPIRWLWEHRIPLDMLSIIEGPPGVGKSTILAAVMATLSRGEPLPYSELRMEPAHCLLVAPEDSVAHVCKPRLMAAGADMRFVHHIKGVETTKGGETKIERFTLKEEFLLLLEEHVRAANIKLVYVDAVMGLLPSRVDSSSDHQVRCQVLDPLAEVAKRTGAAVVIGRHWTKGAGDRQAHERGGGSIAFTAAARSVIQVGTLAGDKERKFLSVGKFNNCPQPLSLAYGIVGATVRGDGGAVIETSVIEWQGEHDINVEDLGRTTSTTQPDYCAEWLLAHLGQSGGSLLSAKLEEEAVGKGFSISTLKRARAQLTEAGKLESIQHNRQWWTCLPDQAAVIRINEVFEP